MAMTVLIHPIPPRDSHPISPRVYTGRELRNRISSQISLLASIVSTASVHTDPGVLILEISIPHYTSPCTFTSP